MNIIEAVKTKKPFRRRIYDNVDSGWIEVHNSFFKRGDSIISLRSDDLLADDYEVMYEPMGFVEAVKSGKPFKRLGEKHWNFVSDDGLILRDHGFFNLRIPTKDWMTATDFIVKDD